MTQSGPVQSPNRPPLDTLPTDPWPLSARILESFHETLRQKALSHRPWPFLTLQRFTDDPDPTRVSFFMFECRDGRQLVLRFIRSVPERQAKAIQPVCDVWNACGPSAKAVPCAGLRGASFPGTEGSHDHISLELELAFDEDPFRIDNERLKSKFRDLIRMASCFWKIPFDDESGRRSVPGGAGPG